MFDKLALLILFVGSNGAYACDCSSYPFKPNPPCYGDCVGLLAKDRSIDLKSIKNLDAGVAVGVSVLRNGKNAEAVDFSAINNKRGLENAAAGIVLE